jgi:hypothetical protein
MTDKDRQRLRDRVSLTPHGRLPNWVLVVVAGAFTAAALLAHSLI